MPGARPGMTTIIGSLRRADQVLDLFGVRPEVVRELVEQRLGNRPEARLVDILDDLDAYLLELAGGGVLELEGALRLLCADVVGRRLHPFLLVGGEALPQLV